MFAGRCGASDSNPTPRPSRQWGARLRTRSDDEDVAKKEEQDGDAAKKEDDETPFSVDGELVKAKSYI
jgi:hypothetical protein